MEYRKETVELTVRLVLGIQEGVSTVDVINELDYEFFDTTGKAEILDSEITIVDATI